MCCFRGTNSSSRGGSKGTEDGVAELHCYRNCLDSNIPASPYISKMRLQNKETLPFFVWPHSMQDLSSPLLEPMPPAVGSRSLNHWTDCQGSSNITFLWKTYTQNEEEPTDKVKVTFIQNNHFLLMCIFLSSIGGQAKHIESLGICIFTQVGLGFKYHSSQLVVLYFNSAQLLLSLQDSKRITSKM